MYGMYCNIIDARWKNVVVRTGPTCGVCHVYSVISMVISYQLLSCWMFL